jgi:hypothetical protein
VLRAPLAVISSASLGAAGLRIGPSISPSKSPYLTAIVELGRLLFFCLFPRER